MLSTGAADTKCVHNSVPSGELCSPVGVVDGDSVPIFLVPKWIGAFSLYPSGLEQFLCTQVDWGILFVPKQIVGFVTYVMKIRAGYEKSQMMLDLDDCRAIKVPALGFMDFCDLCQKRKKRIVKFK